jgi:hypothetical protein
MAVYNNDRDPNDVSWERDNKKIDRKLVARKALFNGVISRIDTVITSCEQGKSGEWDCSTDEGKEGFDAMIQLLDEAKLCLIKEKKRTCK